jgi:hypothetical protein
MRQTAYAQSTRRTRFSSRLFIRVLALMSTLAAATLALATLAAPAPPVPTPDCTLVMGGGGAVTAKAQAGRWFAINRMVTAAAIEALERKGYAVASLIVDVRDGNRRLAAMAHELERDKCTRVLQITHALNLDPASFSFSAKVLHAVTNWSDAHSKPGIAFVGDYEQTYSYPLTEETVEAASLAALGARLAADVDAAGILGGRKH